MQAHSHLTISAALLVVTLLTAACTTPGKPAEQTAPSGQSLPSDPQRSRWAPRSRPARCLFAMLMGGCATSELRLLAEQRPGDPNALVLGAKSPCSAVSIGSRTAYVRPRSMRTMNTGRAGRRVSFEHHQWTLVHRRCRSLAGAEPDQRGSASFRRLRGAAPLSRSTRRRASVDAARHGVHQSASRFSGAAAAVRR